MFSKFYPNSHGSHSSPLATTVAIASMTLAVLSTGISSASAGIIYQDSFTGSSATPLDGAAPTIDNGSSAYWNSQGGSGMYDNGTITIPEGVIEIPALAFTPTAGSIYTLSAGLNPTSSSGWFALGFLGNITALYSQWFYGEASPAASPWALVNGARGTGTSTVNTFQSFAGPGTKVKAVNGTDTTGVQDVSIVLNTQASAWTWQVFDNGIAETPVTAYSTNPTITGVGFGGVYPASGTISNFELSSAVPEPTTLALLALSGFGLLLLTRRRTV